MHGSINVILYRWCGLIIRFILVVTDSWHAVWWEVQINTWGVANSNSLYTNSQAYIMRVANSHYKLNRDSWFVVTESLSQAFLHSNSMQTQSQYKHKLCCYWIDSTQVTAVYQTCLLWFYIVPEESHNTELQKRFRGNGFMYIMLLHFHVASLLARSLRAVGSGHGPINRHITSGRCNN